MQFREHPNLGAQEFRNHGNRNVIDRAVLVAFELIQIGQMHRGNENDGGPLKTRVLANHCGQLKTVEFGHAHVHQHHRHIGLEQNFESLLRGLRFDQVLAKLTEHHLIAEQLRGLIIHHEDIDFLVCAHELYYLSVRSRLSKPTAANYYR